MRSGAVTIYPPLFSLLLAMFSSCDYIISSDRTQKNSINCEIYGLMYAENAKKGL